MLAGQDPAPDGKIQNFRMLNFIQKLFGSKTEKDVKELLPIVDQINEEYAKLSSLSDEELQAKTGEFRARIKEATGEIEDEMVQLREELKEDLPHEERIKIFDRLDELQKELEEETKSVLENLLPEAFAVVKD